MIEQQDHIRDLAEIRSMMERSSRFLSLSGLAGVMAGIYALAGTYIAYNVLHFNPGDLAAGDGQTTSCIPNLTEVALLAIAVLVLAVTTAVYLSSRKAHQRGEKAWNAISRRLLTHMAIPLAAGGALILVLLSKGLIGLIIPMTLIFYGLALFNAGMFTYNEVKFLGIVQVLLGLVCASFPTYGLYFWAAGFGIMHVVYGIYIHFRHER